MKMRPCAVSGMFYPKDPDHLEQLLAKFFRNAGCCTGIRRGSWYLMQGIFIQEESRPYSYASINPGFSGTFILMGPSHRGF